MIKSQPSLLKYHILRIFFIPQLALIVNGDKRTSVSFNRCDNSLAVNCLNSVRQIGKADNAKLFFTSTQTNVRGKSTRHQDNQRFHVANEM